MVDLAKLVVSLEAESAKLRADLDKANKHLEGFGRKANKTSLFVKNAVAGMLSAFSVTTFVQFTKASVEYADAIGKTADKIGLTTTALQELRYAAQITGVEQRTLDMAMQRFSRRVGEVAQGTGVLKAEFDRYNIQVRDSTGAMRPLEQILDDYAEVVRGAEGDQEKLRLAFKAFDSEGAAMVNTLRGGKEALDQLRVAAREAGVVLDENLIRTAEDVNDRWNTLVQTIGVKFQSAVLNSIAVIDSYLNPEGRNKFNELFARRQELLEQIASAEERSSLWYGGLRGEENKASHIANLKRLLEEVNAELREMQDANVKLIQSTGKLTGFQNGNAESTGNQKAAIDDMTGPLSEFNKLMEDAARLTIEVVTPSEEFTRSVERLNAMLDNSFISLETYNRALEKTGKEYADAMSKMVDQTDELENEWDDVAKTMLNAFENATRGADSFSSELDELLYKLLQVFADPLFDWLGGLFGASGSSGGSSTGSTTIATPAMATGTNYVPRDMLALVHKGEAVIPKAYNPAAGGSTGNVTVNVVESPGNGGEVTQTEQDGQTIIEVMVEQVKREMVRDVRTGGDFSQSMQSQYGLNRARGAY